MNDNYFTTNTGSGYIFNNTRIEGDLVIKSSSTTANEPDYTKISAQLLELLAINKLSDIEKMIIREAHDACSRKNKSKLREKLELLSKSALSFVKDVTANILAALLIKPN